MSNSTEKKQSIKMSHLINMIDLLEDIKEQTIKPGIEHLCQDCGRYLLSLPINKGKKQFQISTWYPLNCDFCNKIKDVTEVRDFGYPNLPKINPNSN